MYDNACHSAAAVSQTAAVPTIGAGRIGKHIDAPAILTTNQGRIFCDSVRVIDEGISLIKGR